MRKDILTGTPVPNKPEDKNTQFRFLFPFGGDPEKKFWVRTTKKQLNLPDPNIIPTNVEMSKPQLRVIRFCDDKFFT